MAPVLEIDSLLESPLSDLHALAGELDIEGYRLLRKADLTIAILESRGAIGDEIRPKVEAKAAELAAQRAERERIAAEREEAEEAAREAAAEQRRERSGSGSGARGDRQRGQRGGRGRGGRDGDRKPRERGEKTSAREGDRKPRERGGRDQRDGGRRGRDAKPAVAAEAKTENVPTVAISGVFEPGSGGGGRLRTDLSRRVRGDADVQRGEVRKWRLHRGDTIVGEAKKIKRGRTDHQLVSITSVNGQNAEQRAADKVRFGDAEAAAPGERFAKRLFKHAPVHAGSRVVITGPTRAAAAEMTAKLAADLAGSGVTTAMVVTVAGPQAPAASGFDLISNEAGKPAEDCLQSLELVLERAKRVAESGGNAAVLVDGLDLLPAEKAAEILGSSRNLAQHGSLTVIGSAGAGSALEAHATTIAVVAGGRRLKLDKKASWSSQK